MLKFYKCSKCGNVVELISDKGGELFCCGEAMKELTANTVDASKEKHVPAVEPADGKLIARVGAVTHPMEEKHYIEWILFDDGCSVKRVALKPNDVPEACHKAVDKCDVYAYCNLHGLWKTSYSK